jgi:hypothetical protein
MIAQHVAALQQGMGTEAESHAAATADDARTLLQGSRYDIIHLHGCWRNSSYSITRQAMKKGARLVITPHGQLEPWVQNDGYWKEKLPKRLLYQRNQMRKAYAVIIQGKMEEECMKRLSWNSRCIIIRNAIVTQSITPKEMAKQTFALYRKVTDSDTLSLMTQETRTVLRLLMKAGITGDIRWLSEQDIDYLKQPEVRGNIQWRELLCYAHQEDITDTIQRGVRILQLDAPDIDVEDIPYFLPDNYQQTQSIGQTIGNQFVSENDRLIATFKLIKKLIANGQFSIRHLVELDRELRQYGCDEDLLEEQLTERQLLPTARRTMQLMAMTTGLTEGFMPVVPLHDRTTKKLYQQIENHLKI